MIRVMIVIVMAVVVLGDGRWLGLWSGGEGWQG